MTMLLKKYSLSAVLRNAEGGGGGGGEGDGGAAAAAAASPESLLFPNEGGDQTGADKGEGAETTGDKGGDQTAGDWKEYVTDPNKTDEENAAAKAEHDKTKPADDDKNKGNDPLDIVPEDGNYNLTMPEGIEVDQKMLDALSPRLKAKGYTHREAQELTDEFIKVQQDQARTRMENWANTQQQWVTDAKADKEIGGDNFDGSVKNARRALDTLGTPELRDYLNASGGGNHPELIRYFAKVGAMIREDNPAAGGAEGKGNPADPAHILFPNDAPKG